MKKVLIPVDGSSQSLAAVRAAVREGPASISRIDLLNVQPLLNRHISRWVSKRQRDDWRSARSQAALEQASQVMKTSGIPWQAHTMAGPVAASVAAAARTMGSDEIVVGSRRHGLFERAFANSLSARLLETSGVPVRVVPTDGPPLIERIAVPAGVGLIALVLMID